MGQPAMRAGTGPAKKGHKYIIYNIISTLQAVLHGKQDMHKYNHIAGYFSIILCLSSLK